MDVTFIEGLGHRMMNMALDNLARDGYVAFACLLLSKDRTELVPIIPETVDEDSKTALAKMLRLIAPHSAAIILIYEMWTLEGERALQILRDDTRVADDPARKEGVFVQVASPRGDLVLTTSFSRDAKDKPIRPAEVKAAWQSGACSGKFNGLFAQQ